MGDRISKEYLINLCDVLTAQLAAALREKELAVVENGLLQALLDQKNEEEVKREEVCDAEQPKVMNPYPINPTTAAALGAVERALTEIRDAHPIKTGGDLQAIDNLNRILSEINWAVSYGARVRPTGERTNEIYDLLYT